MIRKVPACADDEVFLSRLYAETRSEEMQAFGWDRAMLDSFLAMQWRAQKMSYDLQYPGAEQTILLFQNQPAGRMIVSRTCGEIRLVDVCLLSEYRNRGIGTFLLEELQKKAVSADLPLRLRVLKGNPAKNLYSRLGFIVTEENEMHDSMEWSGSHRIRLSNN